MVVGSDGINATEREELFLGVFLEAFWETGFCRESKALGTGLLLKKHYGMGGLPWVARFLYIQLVGDYWGSRKRQVATDGRSTFRGETGVFGQWVECCV